MNKFRFTINALAIAIFTFAFASMAQAQATRTWVSGVGDDANPCSRTAPCKTFAGAISKTADKGEISVLDPGGFGTVTITKGITLNGDGTLAGILSAGTNAVNVQAGANDVIIIRNISINGAGTGLNGIRFISGKHLRVESCSIYGITGNGIDVGHNGTGAGELTVDNTSITNLGGVGVRVAATLGTPTAVLNKVRIQRAAFGFDVLQGSGTITNSTIADIANQAVVAENTTVVNVVGCTLSHNGTGISAFSNGATVNFANCDVFKNGTGLTVVAGATGNRFGNSRIFNNTTDENIAGTLNLGNNR